MKDVIICDLEKRVITEDLSGYSYEALVESYFDSDKYSTILKRKIDKYESLEKKQDMSPEEKEELNELEKYFNQIPDFFSDELIVKLQNRFDLKNLKKKK